MKNIKLLDNNTVNKIAAGEVVERPSSVVKELCENSIDAGASAVTIEIRDGGTSLIKISDNGSGIPKDQVETAFLRHATSKIETIDDLDSVYSLGFRGEALASIAAVSQVEMITKTEGQEAGYKIEIHGGYVTGAEDFAATAGTTISVKNLFYNVPARRKFLKKATTESGYISDMIHKLALAHPEISIKYINNGNTMLHTSGNNSLLTAVYHVYGKEISQKMLEITCTQGDLKIDGLIGKPELSRGNRNYENLFINGRFVKNAVVSQAVEDAYKTRLMIGKFPVFVLNLTLNADMVDVNVHPAKLEVRFRDDDLVYDFVYTAVFDALKKAVLIPEADWDSKPSPKIKEMMSTAELSEQKTAEKEGKPVQSPQNPDLSNTGKTDKKTTETAQTTGNKEAQTPVQEVLNKEIFSSAQNKVNYTQPATSFEELQKLYKSKLESEGPDGGKTIIKEGKLSYIVAPSGLEDAVSSNTTEKAEEKEPELFFNNYKIIGQIFATYWIVEQDKSIFMIDQHAAHERILFEEIYNKFSKGDIVSQRLLQPLALNLSERERAILKENIELMGKLGFELEDFGDMGFVLNSMPYIFQNPENLGFFTEILDSLDVNTIQNAYDTQLHAIATIACKAAVKANDKLNVQEAISMIQNLLRLENPFSCPHGRPTIIELTEYELEKKFKRIQ